MATSEKNEVPLVSVFDDEDCDAFMVVVLHWGTDFSGTFEEQRRIYRAAVRRAEHAFPATYPKNNVGYWKEVTFGPEREARDPPYPAVISFHEQMCSFFLRHHQDGDNDTFLHSRKSCLVRYLVATIESVVQSDRLQLARVLGSIAANDAYYVEKGNENGPLAIAFEIDEPFEAAVMAMLTTIYSDCTCGDADADANNWFAIDNDEVAAAAAAKSRGKKRCTYEDSESEDDANNDASPSPIPWIRAKKARSSE